MTNLPDSKQISQTQMAAAAKELQQARVIEWAPSFSLRRFLANKGLLQTPFERAMAGHTFIMRPR